MSPDRSHDASQTLLVNQEAIVTRERKGGYEFRPSRKVGAQILSMLHDIHHDLRFTLPDLAKRHERPERLVHLQTFAMLYCNNTSRFNETVTREQPHDRRVEICRIRRIEVTEIEPAVATSEILEC